MSLLFMFYIRPLPADEEKNELKNFYTFSWAQEHRPYGQSKSEKWKAMRLGSPEETEMSHIQNSEVLNGDFNGDKDSKENISSTESSKDVRKDDASDASDSSEKSMSMKKLLFNFYKELRYRPKRALERYIMLEFCPVL